MRLREKLIHYTNGLGDVDLKQEVIATIEHIAQYMDEDELLHHSRPLALAYLALTEDASAPVVRCKDCKHSCKDGTGRTCEGYWYELSEFAVSVEDDDFCSYGEQKDGGASNG